MKTNDLYSYENELRKQGLSLICGIDEAGRGPLAGPVCAAACILPAELKIEARNCHGSWNRRCGFKPAYLLNAQRRKTCRASLRSTSGVRLVI